MGAGFPKSAMAPGDWKLERLKHHHNPCSVLFTRGLIQKDV